MTSKKNDFFIIFIIQELYDPVGWKKRKNLLIFGFCRLFMQCNYFSDKAENM